MRPPRLPIPVAPARHETLASYLTRLANLHGLPPRQLWEPISTPRPGTGRREVVPDRLAAITGRPGEHLARALPELRDPAPDWAAWRHQPQPGCPRCDARHQGGPVTRLRPHHRYLCQRHRYWILFRARLGRSGVGGRDSDLSATRTCETVKPCQPVSLLLTVTTR